MMEVVFFIVILSDDLVINLVGIKTGDYAVSVAPKHTGWIEMYTFNWVEIEHTQLGNVFV